MLIFNEIPTAFPFYDKLEKQARYNDNCDGTCDYKLITPNNALLPFQFKRLLNSDTISGWEIMDANNSTIINASTARAAIHTVTVGQEKYYYYDGSPFASITMLPGFYYSVVTFNNGIKFYSEVFCVPFDSFAVGGANGFLKLEWYSTCSIYPYYYGETINSVPYFRNVTYLDTFVQGSEPEIVVETEPNGDGEEIPVFQRAVIKYRIPHAVSDYLKKALVIMQMHNVINLTTANGVHSGQISSVTTASAPLDTGCLSTIDILFEQDAAIVKTSCC